MDNKKNLDVLNDEELEMVSGGANEVTKETVNRYCDKCEDIRYFRLVSGGRAFCTTCGNQIVI